MHLHCRAFITALAIGNTIRVFKVSKKKEGSRSSVTGEFDFPVKHSAEIINIAVASHGKFIMSCSRDTTIILWNLKGVCLLHFYGYILIEMLTKYQCHCAISCKSQTVLEHISNHEQLHNWILIMHKALGKFKLCLKCIYLPWFDVVFCCLFVVVDF